MLAAVTVWASPAAADSRPVRTAQVGPLPAAQPAALPTVDGVPFLIRFAGTVRGPKAGAAVEIQGIRIGDVRSIGLEYVPDSNSFVAPVVIELQPSLFPAFGPQPRTAEEPMRRLMRWSNAGCVDVELLADVGDLAGGAEAMEADEAAFEADIPLPAHITAASTATRPHGTCREPPSRRRGILLFE